MFFETPGTRPDVAGFRPCDTGGHIRGDGGLRPAFSYNSVDAGAVVPSVIPTDVDAFVFDLDGTLLDTERLYREAFKATCTDFALPFVEAAHRRLVGLSRRERAPLLQAQLGDRFPLDAFLSAYRARKEALLREGVPVRHGALALLRALRVRRFPCAVATSATRDAAFELLRRGLLLAYVDRVVTRDDVEHGKPHPQTHQMAAGFLGAPPGRCLAIEDSAPGMAAARAAGMIPVLLSNQAPNGAAAGCGHAVARLADLPLPAPRR